MSTILSVDLSIVRPVYTRQLSGAARARMLLGLSIGERIAQLEEKLAALRAEQREELVLTIRERHRHRHRLLRARALAARGL